MTGWIPGQITRFKKVVKEKSCIFLKDRKKMRKTKMGMRKSFIFLKRQERQMEVLVCPESECMHIYFFLNLSAPIAQIKDYTFAKLDKF